tara:strand:+ start:186 stop:662 length:477 start_codon:yes stop_codon:yes gene_type:complete
MAKCDYTTFVENHPRDDFELIPAGSYDLEILSVEDKPNSKGTGEFTTISFKIIGGEHASRRVWAHYNLGHEKQQVADISQKEITPLFRAAGINHEELDTDYLVGERANAKIYIEPSDRGDRNVIDNRTWRTIDTTTKSAASPPQPVSPPAAVATASDW